MKRPTAVLVGELSVYPWDRAHDLLQGVDLLVVRELTGGIYFGEQRRGTHASGEYATDTCTYTTGEIERVVVCGHPTISRPITNLLGRDDVEVVSVVPRGRWAERPFAVDTSTSPISCSLLNSPEGSTVRFLSPD